MYQAKTPSVGHANTTDKIQRIVQLRDKETHRFFLGERAAECTAYVYRYDQSKGVCP